MRKVSEKLVRALRRDQHDGARFLNPTLLVWVGGCLEAWRSDPAMRRPKDDGPESPRTVDAAGLGTCMADTMTGLGPAGHGEMRYGVWEGTPFAHNRDTGASVKPQVWAA